MLCDGAVILAREGSAELAALEKSIERGDVIGGSGRKTGPAPAKGSAAALSSIERRLQAVKRLLEQSLISTEEAKHKRTEILKSL